MTEPTIFSRGDAHDERVQVLLTADEYIFARDEALSRGISTSAYLRLLLNNDRRLLAQKQLSALGSEVDTPQPTHDMHSFIKTLALLVKAEL
jgi:hypothetical protein